ncbi:MAG: hypothetical protein IJW53_03465 [Clostridia bacterium]|nr:hypothetical protein [Clostridia bacterium]
MKKTVCAICLLLIFCLVFSSCYTPAGIKIGFDGKWGLLPEVYFGVKSDNTEFPIDDVTLDFSYGNGAASGVGGFVGGDNGEDCPIVCVAVYFFNAKYQDTAAGYGEARFEDYKEIEGLYFVKEIGIDDYNDNYGVKNNFLSCKYEHTEALTIPEEVMELSVGYACLGVFQIAYVPSTNLYRIVGGGYQALKYEKLDADTVRISEPVGSHYENPK